MAPNPIISTNKDLAEIERIKSALKLIGLGDVLSEKTIDTFGTKEVEKKISENPYVLMGVEGINFTRADRIAQGFYGIKEDDPRRSKALIAKVIDDNKSFGHTFLPITTLERKIKKLKIEIPNMHATIDSMQTDDLVVVEDNRIFTARLFRAEVDVATELYQRSKLKNPIEFVSSLKASVSLENLQMNDPDQEKAVKLSLSGTNILIITGGPGTGKTFTVKKICDLSNGPIALCAPTGKAAKRLEELTKRSAKTIHRMLGASFRGWRFWKHNQLKGFKTIVVDESSMLDIELAWRLLQAIPRSTQIIFVGDVDQLPPVGPGSFYRDIIACKKFSVVRLQTNHRQGLGSSIADNAIAINKGAMQLSFDDDMWYEQSENPIDLRARIPQLIKTDRFKNYDPIQEIQVLTPQRGTSIGVNSLNTLLRKTFNKSASAFEDFSVGDKVMQTKNNYNLNVFNGYVGQIIEKSATFLRIQFFDSGILDYPVEDSKDLQHAYATTIHKFQGSEMKAGVIVISSSHTWMLTRNLLYTGITRFKEKCIIIGDLAGLKRAIRNTKEDERFSRLVGRIEDLEAQGA